MKKLLSNEYYICKGSASIPLNVLDSEQTVDPGYAYFVKIFGLVEERLEVDGLVFYLTSNVYELPSYGQNIVAVVVGDEWCRIPMYFYKVRAVFKCYGTRPILECNLLLKPSFPNFINLIKFLRNCFMYLPGSVNYVFHWFKSLRLDTSKIPPIYTIPLGYYNQLELPIKDVELRLYDVFFAGSMSLNHYSIWSSRYWFGLPKNLSRKKLILSINEIKEKYPNFKVELLITSGFGSGHKGCVDAMTYSEKMMDAKICLVPRGNSLETYRFFEALRYGCIVVAEALPPWWFYNGSPAIRITDWSNLESLLEKLSENKRLMQEKHQESLNWWKTKCSEAAVAAYIVEKLGINPVA